MKKILLSCVTCLLAVGLLAGCDDEVEEVTPEDPNAGIVEPSGDDSGTGGGTVSGDDGSGTVKEPEPELAPQFLEVDELVDGESYYLGFPYTAAYTTDWYLFDGTTDDYGDYLQCSVVGTEDFEPVEVKVSITEADPVVPESVETIGLTFTKLVEGVETEYTIYAWPSTTGTYGEITFIETSLLNAEEGGANSGAVTDFTWDAERGTLDVKLSNGDWYFSTYQGKSSVSLSATSTNYACSHFYVANPDYVGPEYVAPNTSSDETYKLGCFDVDNYAYRYFNGATVNSYLNTTAEWSEGADVFITDQPKDGIENSCTLSFINASGELKYIANNDATTFTFSDDPCVWVWDEENEVFAQADCGRAMFFYESASHDYTIRAYYRNDTYLAYPHVIAYSENPGVAVRPAVTSIAVTTAAGETSGTVEEGKTLQLSAAIEPEHALTDVTWTSDNEECATVSEDGLVSGVAATTEGSPVTITATSVSTPSVSGSIQITVTAPEPLVYKESETITADEISSQYNVSSGGVVPTLYLSLTTVSWGTTSDSSSGNSKYYDSTQTNPSNQIRVYNKDTITFTPVDETIATISKIVFEHDAESVQGGDACTLKDSSNNDAGTITKQSTTAPYTVTLEVSASGAVTFTNTGSSNVQLHFTSMTIYYSDPTAANTGR